MTTANTDERAPAEPVAPPPAAAPEPARSGRIAGAFNVFSHAFLLVWGVLVTFPLAWAVLSAFKTDREILVSPWRLPSSLQFDNFVRAWTRAQIGEFFFNTVIVVGGSLILTMLLGSMAAYVLARYDFPGNRFIYYLFVGGMSFPVFLALVPLFFTVNNLGLRGGNTIYLGLILVYAAYSLPFTVFFLTAFFRTLPTTVAEAALIDGCSHEGLFFRVMLPMAKPGLLSVGIFNFLGQWNQYLLPLVLDQGPDAKPVLAQGLVSLAVSQGYRGDFSGLFAGLVVAMLPVLIVYLVFQRQVQSGLTAGALK